jgi:DNA-binding NarL/FixJ family response regulator
MINVLIADNQALTRAGIIALLAPVININVIGCADNIAELQQLTDKYQVQVIVMDQYFDVGEINDLSLYFNPEKVVLLSNNLQLSDLPGLKDIGIRSYLSKICKREELITAIHATAKAEEFICLKTRHMLFNAEPEPEKAEAIAQLSTRETEIVHLIADGLANKDIAEKLFLSVHTIKTHRKNIIRKLGFTFKNAAELILLLSSFNDFI